jgi:hypothetical protein
MPWPAYASYRQSKTDVMAKNAPTSLGVLLELARHDDSIYLMVVDRKFRFPNDYSAANFHFPDVHAAIPGSGPEIKTGWLVYIKYDKDTSVREYLSEWGHLLDYLLLCW